MKKIVILTENYFEYVMGGAEQQISLLVPELIKRGHEVHYIYISYNSCNPEPTINVNLHPVKVKKYVRKLRPNIVLYTTAICKILKNIKPDVIYQQAKPALCGIAAKYAKNNNCKLIWHIAARGDVLPYYHKSFKTMIFDYLDRKCAEYGIRNADYIVGQATYQDNLLFENYSKRCAAIIGNWHPMPKEKCNKKLPIKVVWVANIKRHKQPRIYIDLVEKMQNLDNVDFYMVGRPISGGYQQMIERRINKLDNLKYLGEISNDGVNRLLSRSHVFVSTSQSEGFSNTFIQAWMHNLPVVSLNSDPDDILKEKRIGLHSKNFEQLVCDVELLVKDDMLRNKMGDRARFYAEHNHSISENIGKLIGIIHEE